MKKITIYTILFIVALTIIYFYPRGELGKSVDFNIKIDNNKLNLKPSAVGVYISLSDMCRESDWNTGTLTPSVTYKKIAFSSSGNTFSGSVPTKISKHFCSWKLVYIDFFLNNSEYQELVKKYNISYDKYLYTANISQKEEYNSDKATKLKNGKLNIDSYCALIKNRHDSIMDYTYETLSLVCSSKSSGYNNKIVIDGNFSSLKSINMNFNIDTAKTYCTVRKRDCPKNTTNIYIGKLEKMLDIKSGKRKKVEVKYDYKANNKVIREFVKSVNIDDDNNYTRAKEILDKNDSFLKDSGYKITQRALAWEFAHNDIEFKTLKLLYKHGFNLQKDKYDINKKAEKIIAKYNIEPNIFCPNYDYNELPKEIQDILAKNGITLKNYYKKLKKQESIESVISIYRKDSLKVIKWLLNNGYKLKDDDLGYMLSNMLRYNKEINSIEAIELFKKLKLNFKDNDISYSLLRTMRDIRFKDIKTLKALIEAGVNINAKSEYGQTIIYSLNYKLQDKYRNVCSIGYNIDTIKEYIKLGLDINATDKQGNTVADNEYRDHFYCNLKALKKLGVKWKAKYDKIFVKQQ